MERYRGAERLTKTVTDIARAVHCKIDYLDSLQLTFPIEKKTQILCQFLCCACLIIEPCD